VTPDGMIAWNGFQRTDVRRNDPTRPLMPYFKPELYGLPESVAVVATVLACVPEMRGNSC
jgi:hypothetical protein